MKSTLVLILILLSISAKATLILDDVSCSTSTSSWTCSTSTSVVSDSSVEFGIILGNSFRAFDLDIDANSIRYDVLISVGNIGGLDPISLFDIDSDITGYTFNTNITGIDASRLSFSADNFDVNFDGLTTQVGQFLEITLQTASVPEPSTLAIFVLGVIGLASRRYKKQC